MILRLLADYHLAQSQPLRPGRNSALFALPLGSI